MKHMFSVDWPRIVRGKQTGLCEPTSMQPSTSSRYAAKPNWDRGYTFTAGRSMLAATNPCRGVDQLSLALTAGQPALTLDLTFDSGRDERGKAQTEDLRQKLEETSAPAPPRLLSTVKAVHKPGTMTVLGHGRSEDETEAEWRTSHNNSSQQRQSSRLQTLCSRSAA